MKKATSGDNFFISNADGVRSFVRLTGNSMKESPELGKKGLAVGMFFRDGMPQGKWAFASLMKGVDGRTALETSDRTLRPLLQSLVYPANPNWARTQAAGSQGAWGVPGFYAKGGYNKLVQKGVLPCIATRKDHAT